MNGGRAAATQLWTVPTGKKNRVKMEERREWWVQVGGKRKERREEKNIFAFITVQSTEYRQRDRDRHSLLSELVEVGMEERKGMPRSTSRISLLQQKWEREREREIFYCKGGEASKGKEMGVCTQQNGNFWNGKKRVKILFFFFEFKPSLSSADQISSFGCIFLSSLASGEPSILRR